MKTMEYNSRFLENTSIFTTAEEDYLESLANEYSIDQLLRNRRQYENRTVDYAYVSGKIEGNQYSRKGAAMLLQYGFTEAGRTYQDAAMLVNLRDAFAAVMKNAGGNITDVLSKHYVQAVHSQVAAQLLRTEARGQVRRRPVAISGSGYLPLTSPCALEYAFEKMLETAGKITRPFSQAVYVHCNLAYLQYFEDGNKRTSRLMQTAILAAHQLTPIFLQEKSIPDYLTSVLHYYETGDYTLYKRLFLKEYKHTIEELQGKAPEQLLAEKRALERIRGSRR